MKSLILIWSLIFSSLLQAYPVGVKGAGQATKYPAVIDFGDSSVTHNAGVSKLVSANPKNYITAIDGSKIGAWTTFADGTGSTEPDGAYKPVDGTGGSPTATFAVSTDSSISGTTNFLFTHTAASNAGDGFSYPFTIDPVDQGKVIRLTFDYKIASGTYADDGLRFWIYDVTNATLIQPAPYKLKNSGIIEHQQSMEFQTASNSTSYRLIAIVSNNTATAYTIRFTNFNLGQQVKSYGGMGDDVYSAKVSATGVVSDETKDFINGNCAITDTSLYTCSFNTSFFSVAPNCQVTIAENAVNLTTEAKLNDNSTTASAVIRTGASSDTTAYSKTAYKFTLSCQKQGVDYANAMGGRVLSSDADTRVVAASASATSTSVSTATPNITYTTTSINTDGAFDGTAYTVKTPGLYRLNTNYLSASSVWSATHQLIAYYNINGGSNNEIGRTIAQTTATYMMNVRGYALLDLKTGDVLRTALYSSVTQTPIIAKFSIEKLSGPAQIASVEAVYFSANTSTTAATTSTPFIYSVVSDNSHGAYSSATGKFTAPMNGMYHFEFSILSSANASPVLYKGTTAVCQGSSTNTGNTVALGNCTIRLLTGDTVEVRPDISATATGGATKNVFSGSRIGL